MAADARPDALNGWDRVLASGLRDNAVGISIDWPRIPLPNTRSLLQRSAALGLRVATLLDTDNPVPGITNGTIVKHLRALGVVSGTDLRMRAGWGARDANGRINPGGGKVETRSWTETEKAALRAGFAAEGIDESRGFALLGCAIDVHINHANCWRGVPEAAWHFVIGGYLVIKKWLSYREETVLDRPLTKEEAREVTAIVRRLTALILLSDELDANYAACRDNACVWPPA